MCNRTIFFCLPDGKISKESISHGGERPGIFAHPDEDGEQTTRPPKRRVQGPSIIRFLSSFGRQVVQPYRS